jgi:Tfp pilus assembly protein PilO
MLVNRTSRWSIGAAVLCVALLVASWFLLISPRRADAGTVRAQVVSTDSKATTLQMQIAQLKVEFADLPKQKAQLKAIKAQLPPKGDVPALVRQLQKLAADAGVSLDSVAPGSPAVLTAPGATAAGTAGPGTVVSIPMTIDITGDYFEDSLFVKNLQTKIKRSFLISSINVAAAATDNAVITSASPTNPTGAAPTSPGTAPTSPGTAPTSPGAAPTSPPAAPTVSPTPTPTSTVSPTTIVNPLVRAGLTITGSVFVMLDESSTLQSVATDAKAATSGTTSTTAPTTSPTAG